MRRAGRAGVLFSCALAACANHVRFEEHEVHSEQRSALVSSAELVRPELLLREPVLHLELRRRERAYFRSELRRERAELATPYDARRELLELPLGLLALPLALGRAAADAALLGRLPGPALAPLHWSGAALNPLLNTEDPARLRRRALGADAEPPLSREEEHGGPLAHHVVALAFDGRREWLAQTDAAGVLECSLLGQLRALAPARVPRRIRLRVRDARGAELLTHSIFVERRLAQRLERAWPAARLAHDPATPPQLLGRALAALGRLGFGAEAQLWQQAAEARLAQQPDALAALQRGAAVAARSRGSLDALLRSLAQPQAGPAATLPAAREH